MMKNKPKLLYVVTQGHWGGAQKYIADLAENLKNDFEITVAVGEPNKNPDLQKLFISNPDIKLIQLSFLARDISPIKDLLAFFELKNLYRRIKPNIIHLNSSKAGVLGTLASYSLFPKHRSIFYTAHGWVFNEPLSKKKKKIYITAEKFTAKKKDKIIVLSEKEKIDAIQTLQIPKEKLQIIPTGIDITPEKNDKQTAQKSLARLLKKPDNFLDNSYIVGTIANFYNTKNLDNLIRAAALLKHKTNNFKIIIIGEGPERKLLEDTIKAYNVQNLVFLTGFIKNAKEFLPAFDVFVLPSKKEGMPYTVLEAMANQIPVISTAVGAIPDLIENKKTGILVNPENEKELSDAIFFAFSNPEIMENMAKEGQKNAHNYSIKNVVQKTTSLYLKSLS